VCIDDTGVFNCSWKKKDLMEKVKTSQFIHGRVFRMHGHVSHAETTDTIRLSHTNVLNLRTVVHLAITCSIKKPVISRTVVRKEHTVVCIPISIAQTVFPFF